MSVRDMQVLDILSEVTKLGGEDTGWLVRTDEEDGYFVHIHRGTIRNAAGALIGFVTTCMSRKPDLQAAVIDAAEQFQRAIA